MIWCVLWLLFWATSPPLTWRRREGKSGCSLQLMYLKPQLCLHLISLDNYALKAAQAEVGLSDTWNSAISKLNEPILMMKLWLCNLFRCSKTNRSIRVKSVEQSQNTQSPEELISQVCNRKRKQLCRWTRGVESNQLVLMPTNTKKKIKPYMAWKTPYTTINRDMSENCCQEILQSKQTDLLYHSLYIPVQWKITFTIY